MSTSTSEIPVGHVTDVASIRALETAYQEIHGLEVSVTAGTWSNEAIQPPPSGKTAYRFVVSSEKAHLRLKSGDGVRGGIGEAYEDVDPHPARISPGAEEVWPGDALISNEKLGSLDLSGSGVYFEVITVSTDYPAPKLSLLRNLSDHPGGCAPYYGAFRRETIPPAPTASGDPIGSNRVNEHTLDMRIDRQPPPTRHHHGTVTGADGRVYNHTETAVVLPRSVYGRPPVGDGGAGHAVIYRDPLNKGTGDSFTVPLTPGSIVVTPSTTERLYGHCFENAFAMLVAIPGFVVPYELIPE
ncbi:TPA: hypothetical protein DCE37_14125 [Candidatus Latescibacteria bacterium]|nr:hypothetical protein [Candidatus Latescibacterota bacterium]